MGIPKKSRSGATALEFAIVAPVIFLLFFGAFEFARMNLIRHTVDVAAYEACRRGILPGADASNVRTQAEEVLNVIGVTGAVITVTPATISRTDTQVTVDIEVALDDQAWVPVNFLAGGTATGSCTLTREDY